MIASENFVESYSKEERWYPHLNKKHVGFFHNGIMVHGIEFEKYGDRFSKVFEGKFENGYRKEGQEFFSFGSISFEGEYQDGKKKWGKVFHPNGNLRFKGEFENGHYKYGKCFHVKHGGISSEGEYDAKNALVNGIVYIYRPNRILFSEETFVNYKTVSVKQYRPDTTLFYDGKPDYSYGSLYNKTGNILYIGYLKKPKKYPHDFFFHGDGTLFFPNTEVVRYEGKWKNGVYEGKGKEYRVDSTVYQEGHFKMGKLHGNGIRYKENGFDILCKGKFIGGNFFDEDLFSIRKFMETNDVSFLKKVTKQSLVSYIFDSYHESVSTKFTKPKIISLLQEFYKKYEIEEANEEVKTEDLFGNTIVCPCLGNDGETYDLSSMEYLFLKNQQGEYVNIPYCYDVHENRVPNYPRMKNGICLSSFIVQLDM